MFLFAYYAAVEIKYFLRIHQLKKWKNNLHAVEWLQVFLYNTNNLYSILEFQVTILNTNNLYKIIEF